MWKSLLTPHNVFVFLVLLVLGVGWLIGRLDTSIAVPLITSIGGIGVGASVLSSGVNIGLPLTAPDPTPAPAPSEQVVHVQAVAA